MHYSKVLSSTFRTLWQKKRLWVISLVATLPANLTNFIVYAFYNSVVILFFAIAFSGKSTANFDSGDLVVLFANSDMELVVILLAFCFFIFFICSLYFSLVAKALMIRVSKSYNLNFSEKINYSEYWNSSSRYWFGLFKAGLVTFMLILIFIFPSLLISFLMGFVGENAILALILLVLYCVLYIPMLLSIVIITVLAEFIYRNVVIKKQSTLHASKDAFVTIKKNFWKVVLSYMMFYGISMVFSILYFIILGVILIFDIAISFIFGAMIMSGGFLSLLILLIVSIVIWLFMITLTSPVMAFYEIYWSNVYLELNKHIKND